MPKHFNARPNKIMNEKKKIPPIAALIPFLLIIGAVYLVVKFVVWIFSVNKSVNKLPETVPTNAETENRRKDAETTAFRTIPAEIPAKPVANSIPSVTTPFNPPFSAPFAPKVSVSVPVPEKIAEQIPPLTKVKKKFVTLEVMENIFQRGARGLTRKEAVAALMKIGCGKTAAYDALLENGKFSAWLRFAPDGKITWSDR
jgi:hypothetical protein